MRAFFFVALFTASVLPSLLLTDSAAQDELPVSSSQRVDFTLVFSSLDLAFDTWDDTNAPDTVRLESYRLASGFLAGISFHYETNRDRLVIVEQIDEAAEELEYQGYRQDRDVYFFDYTVWVPSDTYSAARTGRNVRAEGSSAETNLAEARREARQTAFEEATDEAIRAEYTEQGELIPGVVDGRITWYEVTRDEVDSESGEYVFEINAWFSFSGDEQSE